MPLHMINNVSVPETFDLPNRPSLAEKNADEALFDEALALIKEKNALLIAHYYTSPIMQRLCEAAGGTLRQAEHRGRIQRCRRFDRVGA